MTYSFDLDGTITSNPHVFRNLMRDLRKAGAKVLVITGTITECPMTIEDKAHQLAQLGFTLGVDYDELLLATGSVENGFRAVNKHKGELCKAHGVDIHFDDLGDAIRWVKAYSVTTTGVLVMP